MGYKVLSNDVMRGFEPRRGLEGPFIFAGGRILYYDPKEGQYYDPTCDWFVSNEEVNQLHQQLISSLR